MILQLPLSSKKHVTIISAYAPEVTYSDEVKDKLYNDLNCVISIMLHSHKLILLVASVPEFTQTIRPGKE